MRSLVLPVIKSLTTRLTASRRLCRSFPHLKSKASMLSEVSRHSMMSIPSVSTSEALLPDWGRANAITKRAMARQRSSTRMYLPKREADFFNLLMCSREENLTRLLPTPFHWYATNKGRKMKNTSSHGSSNLTILNRTRYTLLIERMPGSCAVI